MRLWLEAVRWTAWSNSWIVPPRTVTSCAAVEADTRVVAAHDRVAVDRVAVEVERDVVGADDEAVGGAVAQVVSQGEAVGDGVAAGGAGSEGRWGRCQADGERTATTGSVSALVSDRRRW